MARKRTRKTLVKPTDSHAVSKFIPRPSEPARTATYWRSNYEAEREANIALRARWWEAQDENARLKEEIESLRKRRPRKRLSQSM